MMRLEVRTVKSEQAAEIYITAQPSSQGRASEQAEESFTAIRDVLRAEGARIFAERIFATMASLESLGSIRAELYEDLDDGVPPTWLTTPHGTCGPVAGVIVHAWRGARPPTVFAPLGMPIGRRLEAAGRTYLSLSGIRADNGACACEQARSMFEKTRTALEQAGGSMHSVVRSWLWLGDILAWYGTFNRVRNQFIFENGLFKGHTGQHRLPASTGIGINPAAHAACAMDVLAMIGDERAVRYLEAGGNQTSAYEYGSAFSRAAVMSGLVGESVFISGTASIDATGRTRHSGDPQGQITTTIENVRAILTDLDYHDADVAGAIAYCKTVEVQRQFRAQQEGLPWPCLTVIAEICRHDLCFEMEVTACRRGPSS